MNIAKKVVLVLTGIVAAGSFLFSLTGFLGWNRWLLELTSHFRIQYLIVQITCVSIFLSLKAWRWIFTTVAFALLNAVLIFSWPASIPAVQTDGPTLSVLQVNLNIGNRDTGHTKIAVSECN